MKINTGKSARPGSWVGKRRNLVLFCFVLLPSARNAPGVQGQRGGGTPRMLTCRARRDHARASRCPFPGANGPCWACGQRCTGGLWGDWAVLRARRLSQGSRGGCQLACVSPSPGAPCWERGPAPGCAFLRLQTSVFWVSPGTGSLSGPRLRHSWVLCSLSLPLPQVEVAGGALPARHGQVTLAAGCWLSQIALFPVTAPLFGSR